MTTNDKVKCACGHELDLSTGDPAPEEVGQLGAMKILHYQCPNCQGTVAEFVREDGSLVWAGPAVRKDLET